MGKLEQIFSQKKPLLLCSMKIERILDKKKALKLLVRKLKKISDPESKLCKAVLINNTLQLLKSSEDIKLQNGKKLEDKISECVPNVQITEGHNVVSSSSPYCNSGPVYFCTNIHMGGWN